MFTIRRLRLDSAAALIGCAVFFVEIGRLVAGGNTRLVSVALLAIVALVAAQAEPSTLLVGLIAVSPLPLFMQGAKVPLTPAIVGAVWLSVLLPRHAKAMAERPTRAVRPYLPILVAIGFITLLSLWGGASDRTSADLGAVGRLAVGMAIFLACLVCLRTEAQLRLAYVGLLISGLLVTVIALLQVVHPVHIPGLLNNAPAVETGSAGLINIRATGPIGDYELLSEMLALAAVVACFFALRSDGFKRVLYAACIPFFFVGIAATETRSGFVIFVLGIVLMILLSRGIQRAHSSRAWIVMGVTLLAAFPVITLLQKSSQTGFLFLRLSQTQTGGGVSKLVNRSGVWNLFLARLPHGWHLLFGQGPAFNYPFYREFPHSLPLTLIFTVGIAGAVAFYTLLISIIVRCARAWAKTRSPYPIVGGLLLVLFVINEVKIEFLRAYGYQWFVWALLGVAAASAVTARRAPSNQTVG
jgi:hypothetical protein